MPLRVVTTAPPPPDAHRTRGIRVLDQEISPTCAGCACATMLAILAGESVSPRMIYELARRYLGWRPDEHGGVPLEAALRAWSLVGALPDEVWEKLGERVGAPDWSLDSHHAAQAARLAPPWFGPLDPLDVRAVRAAVHRWGGVVAALDVHDGWHDLFAFPTLLLLCLKERAGGPIGRAGAAVRGVDPRSGRIPWPAPDTLQLGRHAVVVVGYDAEGFWIQNSVGTDWGDHGCGYVSLADWLANAREVWEVAAPPMRAAA